MVFIYIEYISILTTNTLYWSSHYIVPELGPDVEFSYGSHKAVQEYKEAKAVSSTNFI